MGKRRKSSRKGKKAWRANISTEDIEDFFDNSTNDALSGGSLAQVPSDSLFCLDKSTDLSVKRKIEKHREKVLRCDSILQSNAFVEPVPSSTGKKSKKKSKVQIAKDIALQGQKDLAGGDSSMVDIWDDKAFIALSRDTRPPCIPKEIGFHQAFAQSPATLPSWLTEEDVHYYADKLNKTGFTGGLNYYRNLDKNWELTAPFCGCKIQVPTKFVVGDLDLTYHFSGIKEYIHNGGFKKEVPNLQEVVVMEGAAHFINQEKPDEISAHIYDFIQKF